MTKHPSSGVHLLGPPAPGVVTSHGPLGITLPLGTAEVTVVDLGNNGSSTVVTGSSPAGSSPKTGVAFPY